VVETTGWSPVVAESAALLLVAATLAEVAVELTAGELPVDALPPLAVVATALLVVGEAAVN
jgi:hypothetical protein